MLVPATHLCPRSHWQINLSLTSVAYLYFYHELNSRSNALKCSFNHRKCFHLHIYIACVCHLYLQKDNPPPPVMITGKADPWFVSLFYPHYLLRGHQHLLLSINLCSSSSLPLHIYRWIHQVYLTDALKLKLSECCDYMNEYFGVTHLLECQPFIPGSRSLSPHR